MQKKRQKPNSRTRRRCGWQPRTKYGAKRTIVDGINFASRAESRRYLVLKAQLAAGDIHDLRLQVPYELHVNGKKIGKYIADFVYVGGRGNGDYSTHWHVVEDVKGFKTPLYNWKKKHMAAEYGIDIAEV